MNKFAPYILLGLVASVGASAAIELDSQSALVPTSAEETAELVGDMQLFSTYCVQTNDRFYAMIKQGSNGVASGIFATIMNSAEAVGREVLDAQHLAVERLGAQIAHPDAPIGEAASELEKRIAAGQRAIQAEQTQPRTFFQAIMSTVATSRDMVKESVSSGFEAVKAKLGSLTALRMLERGCVLMAQHEGEMRQLFAGVKAEVVAVKPELSSVSFEQVPCVTARRVVRANAVCSFAKNVQAPAGRLWQTRAAQ